MSTLDINTNGAWRTVLTELRPGKEAEVRQACVVITNASVGPGGRKGGVTWRQRDAEGKAFAHLEHSATPDGEVTTAWRFR